MHENEVSTAQQSNSGQQQLLIFSENLQDGLLYLKEPVVMNHSFLIVEKGKERVLCVQQHLALSFLLGFNSFVTPLLQREDLQERKKSMFLSRKPE